MVGEAELAQDLTQDTFLSAYRNLCRRNAAELDQENTGEEAAKSWQQAPAQNNMSAWLYTIARNAVLSEMRRRKVVRFLPFFHRVSSSAGTGEELDGLADTPQVEPGENLEARTALRDELEQAMSKVGREKLTALLLHMDGFSYKEICDITGDSLSSVKSQIFRAKDSLRRVLNTTGLAPESQEGHL
jgi:RNA polymerase sigma-70 factor (ECF subfamily)